MTTEDVVVTQTKAGEKIEFRGPKSRAIRTITVNREWSVTVDGEAVGTVRYGLITRERRTEGRRYVNARWQSPGWTYMHPNQAWGMEAISKTEAIDRLLTFRKR